MAKMSLLQPIKRYKNLYHDNRSLILGQLTVIKVFRDRLVLRLGIKTSLIFFSFLLCVLFLHSNLYEKNSFADAANDSQKLIYGCQKYDATRHCDRLVGNLASYKFAANSSKVASITDIPKMVPGKITRALELDASRIESVVVPNSPIFDGSNFSVSFWVKRSSVSQPYGHIVSHVNNPPAAGWFFDMVTTDNGTKSFVRFNVPNNTSKVFRSPDILISDNAFVNIIGVFNRTHLMAYLNGELVGQTVFNGTHVTDPNSPLSIGAASYCSGCTTWSGTIDDLRIYNSTLDLNEIKSIASGKSDGSLSNGLVAYYPFDSDTFDKTRYKNNGELSTIVGGMAFAPDGRLFFTEKDDGQIRILKDSKILAEPFVQLDDYFVSWEQGLLGIASDPQFTQNHFVYLYYTSKDKNTGEIFNRVVRFTEQNNKAVDRTVLVDRIFAEEGYHSGGALAFGPDDKLYITVGDATEHPFAQDLSVSIGKVLRINRDGSIPSDNPFPNSPVFTYGHRNIFGVAFDKKSGIGIVTENGDYHYDEINLIKKGGNYGFPLLQPANKPPELADPTQSILPLRSYWKIIAPTQAIYYNADKFPDLKGKFLFGTFAGDIYAIKIDNKTKQVTTEEKIETGIYPFAPIVSLSASPSGDIYFGGYNIYKLNSLDDANKAGTLDSIYTEIPDTTEILDLQYHASKRELDLFLTHASQIHASPSSMTIKIPTSLLTDIYKVTEDNKVSHPPDNVINTEDLESATEIDFNVIDSASDYTTVKIPLQAQGSELISILGS